MRTESVSMRRKIKLVASGGTWTGHLWRKCSRVFDRQSAERIQDFLVQFPESLLKVFICLTRQVEFHLCDFHVKRTQLLVNHVPSDLVVTRSLAHCLLSSFVVGDNAAHHANGLRQRTEEIILREAILLQEILTDDLGHL